MDAKTPNSPNARSLGMGIMEAFAAQLGASLEVSPDAGMSLSVGFSAH